MGLQPDIILLFPGFKLIVLKVELQRVILRHHIRLEHHSVISVPNFVLRSGAIVQDATLGSIDTTIHFTDGGSRRQHKVRLKRRQVAGMIPPYGEYGDAIGRSKGLERIRGMVEHRQGVGRLHRHGKNIAFRIARLFLEARAEDQARAAYQRNH